MAESLTDIAPANPSTREGSCVSIGFDKNSKLSLVLEHFCDLLNRQPLDPPSPEDERKSDGQKISPSDWRARNAVTTGQLEFYHAEVLRLNDTFEGCSVMKADHIYCRRKRSRQRDDELQLIRQQREADREYFRKMARLLPEGGGGSTGGGPVTSYFTVPASSWRTDGDRRC